MASYKVYFVFECSPDTHWGEETDDEVIIYGVEYYKDGEDCLDDEGEESTIDSWEDAVDDITAKWENDSLSEYDYIDQVKNNPRNNGKTEFGDGTGDVNFEATKVEIYSDNNWEKVEEVISGLEPYCHLQDFSREKI